MPPNKCLFLSSALMFRESPSAPFFSKIGPIAPNATETSVKATAHHSVCIVPAPEADKRDSENDYAVAYPAIVLYVLAQISDGENVCPNVRCCDYGIKHAYFPAAHCQQEKRQAKAVAYKPD